MWFQIKCLLCAFALAQGTASDDNDSCMTDIARSPRAKVGSALLQSNHGSAGKLQWDKETFKLLAEEPIRIHELLKQLNFTFRSGARKERTSEIEGALSSMTAGLPKNSLGLFEPATARYALHRLFVQLHRWFIKGMDADFPNQDASAVLKQWVPEKLLALLEDRSGQQGMSAHELAVLAATLEDLIHKEEHKRIDKLLELFALNTEKSLNGSVASVVLDSYMLVFAVNGNITIKSPKRAMKQVMKVKEALPEEWAAFEKDIIKPAFADALGSAGAHGGSATEPVPVDLSGVQIDIDTLKHVSEEIGEKYGPFNDRDCDDVKKVLVSIEGANSGRVPLSKFYQQGNALGSKYSFTEKLDYLRVLGALDESIPAQPQVIIPNYLQSAPNCRLTTAFYSICCRNDCEDLMARLESEIAAPTANVDRIIQVVNSFSQGERPVSANMRMQLEHIASLHNGQVSLHGYNFAEWLHQAFPHDCPYPHDKGTIGAQAADEWLQAMGQEYAKASPEEMLRWI